MKLIYKILLAFLFTSSIAHAEVESWYAYWSVGMANNKYPGDLNKVMDDAESTPGIDRTEIAIDMFGFYFPLSNNRTTLGFVVSDSSDRLSADSEYIQINTYLYAFSGMHFFGNEPGDGFFLRGDIGLTKLAIQTSMLGDASSDTGTGFLLGAGYGIPVSKETRIILGVSYTSKLIEDETFSSTMFTVGGFW